MKGLEIEKTTYKVIFGNFKMLYTPTILRIFTFRQKLSIQEVRIDYNYRLILCPEKISPSALQSDAKLLWQALNELHPGMDRHADTTELAKAFIGIFYPAQRRANNHLIPFGYRCNRK